jgi:pimeloyl-ACP methyl ester carboxylesterase
MVMAAQPDAPISRLVVNDAGPVIEAAALARIGDYLGRATTFATLAEADAYIRAVSAPFGPLTDAQWDHLTRTSVVQDAQGRYALSYDPGIAVPFRSAAAPPDLWPTWDAIRCPTLLLRGAQSDLLSAATAEAMTRRGPKARLVEFPGIGHAPTLLSSDQLAPVIGFLREAP